MKIPNKIIIKELLEKLYILLLNTSILFATERAN